MNDEHDLSEGFPEYQRPPQDIVPHIPDPDAPPLPTGPGQTITVTEWDENGVTYTESEAFIARAITNLDDLYRRNDTDD